MSDDDIDVFIGGWAGRVLEGDFSHGDSLQGTVTTPPGRPDLNPDVPGWQPTPPRPDPTDVTGGGEHRPVFHGEGMRIKISRVRGATSRKIARDLPFYFQAPPLDSWAPSFTGTHTDYDTMEGKQFSRFSSDQLATVGLRTINTVDRYPWTLHRGHFRHTNAIKLLRQIKAKGTPVRLTLWHKGQDKAEFDMDVTLRSVTITENAGEGDARYFDLSFTQWRDATEKRTLKGQWPQSHKLTAKDTLNSLSKKYYKSSKGSRTIGKRNKGLDDWGPNMEIVKHRNYNVGDNIVIPSPPDRAKDSKGGGGGDGDRDYDPYGYPTRDFEVST